MSHQRRSIATILNVSQDAMYFGISLVLVVLACVIYLRSIAIVAATVFLVVCSCLVGYAIYVIILRIEVGFYFWCDKKT